MILRATTLHKTYKGASHDVRILNNLSLVVNKGETVSIMGPSGCGKSTLISILAGLDSADSGSIEVAGQDLRKLSSDQLANFRARQIGIIFQQFHLLPHLTAKENVRLPLDFQKDPEASAKADMALRSVGLGDRGDHFPHQLSRGECQRVAIARVLVLRPQVVFADEPTGSLDQRNAQEVMKLLLDNIRSHDTSLILVTHDPEMARMCQRQLRFVEGQLLDPEVRS